jgi:hypothetical protein
MDRVAAFSEYVLSVDKIFYLYIFVNTYEFRMIYNNNRCEGNYSFIFLHYEYLVS